MERKATSIYHRDISREQAQDVADKQHARSYSYFHRYASHQSISSLIQNVKTESSKWIKNENFCHQPLQWQEGYAAFSYSKKPGKRCGTVYTKPGSASPKRNIFKWIQKVFKSV
jgi:hypothetical protein